MFQLSLEYRIAGASSLHLDTVVAQLLDSRQNVPLKLLVRGDSHLRARDTD